MDFSFQNNTNSAYFFRIEPWGHEFTIDPGSLLLVQPIGVNEKELDLQCSMEAQNLIILSCEGGASDLRVLIDGQVMRA